MTIREPSNSKPINSIDKRFISCKHMLYTNFIIQENKHKLYNRRESLTTFSQNSKQKYRSVPSSPIPSKTKIKIPETKTKSKPIKLKYKSPSENEAKRTSTTESNKKSNTNHSRRKSSIIIQKNSFKENEEKYLKCMEVYQRQSKALKTQLSKYLQEQIKENTEESIMKKSININQSEYKSHLQMRMHYSKGTLNRPIILPFQYMN